MVQNIENLGVTPLILCLENGDQDSCSGIATYILLLRFAWFVEFCPGHRFQKRLLKLYGFIAPNNFFKGIVRKPKVSE